MDLIYTLKGPLFGQDRKYKANEKRALLLETSGVCPICGKQINVFNNVDDIDDIEVSFEKANLQIAHIYGLKNFGKVKHQGNLFHIKNEEYLNSYDNLILLCGGCHGEYDANPSYELYVKMVKFKNELSSNYKREDYVYKALYFSLDEIKSVCERVTINEEDDFEAETFNKKLELNKIDIINSRHYLVYLTDYATSIDNFFKEFDVVGKKLFKCFSSLYDSLKKDESDKNNILKLFAKSKILYQLSKTMNELVFDGLIAYMIWKCEVLDKYDTTK